MLTAKVQCMGKEPVEGEDGQAGAVVVSFGAHDDAAVNDWAVGTPHMSLSVQLSGQAAEAYAPSGMYTLTLAEAE